MTHDDHTAFLNLTHLIPDRAVIRWLPLEVARHCRALAVAADDGVVTVVMAEPADRPARQAVLAALSQRSANTGEAGAGVYFVQGDVAWIDAWLSNLASGDSTPEANRPLAEALDVWLREPLYGDKATISSYAAQVAELLSAPLHQFAPAAPRVAQSPVPVALGRPADMAAFLPRESAPRDRLVILPCVDFNLSGPLQSHDEVGGPATLYACQTRWPLRRLLLIVRGDPVDDAALAWAARLARSSGAAATALMIAPHTPASQAAAFAQHNLVSQAHDDISSLLSANNAIGHKMRQAALRLDALQLDAMLHLRQGAPEVVIREELASTPYDLIIAGVAVRSGDAQWRLRPLLHRLLPDLRCPLLLTGG